MTSAGVITIERFGADAGTGAPQDAWDALLRTLAYENVSENPTTGPGTERTALIEAEDTTGVRSAIVRSTVTVVAVNDPPAAVDPDGPINVAAGRTTTIQPLLNDTDEENDPLFIVRDHRRGRHRDQRQ